MAGRGRRLGSIEIGEMDALEAPAGPAVPADLAATRLCFEHEGRVMTFDGLQRFARAVYDGVEAEPENSHEHLSAVTAAGNWIHFPAGNYWFERDGQRVGESGSCAQHPRATF